MIGMSMCFEDPGDLVAVLRYQREEGISCLGTDGLA
jgi:hypothetical protein